MNKSLTNNSSTVEEPLIEISNYFSIEPTVDVISGPPIFQKTGLIRKSTFNHLKLRMPFSHCKASSCTGQALTVQGNILKISAKSPTLTPINRKFGPKNQKHDR